MGSKSKILDFIFIIFDRTDYAFVCLQRRADFVQTIVFLFVYFYISIFLLFAYIPIQLKQS